MENLFKNRYSPQSQNLAIMSQLSLARTTHQKLNVIMAFWTDIVLDLTRRFRADVTSSIIASLQRTLGGTGCDSGRRFPT